MTECKVTTLDTWLGPLTIVQTAKGVRHAELDDGAPLIVERRLGRGRCILVL